MTNSIDEKVNITKQAYSQIYQDYAKNNASLNPQIQKMLDKFISFVPKGGKVLDVGCAGGRESKYLSANKLKVTGIDILPEFVKLAQTNCPECTFQVVDMRALPDDLGTFDGIWASASFLHVPKENAQQTLKGFWRKLQFFGVLYFSVMEGEFNSTRENKQMNWPARHFSDYLKEEIESLLKISGFKVVYSEVAKTNWGPTFLHYFCKKV